jgi:DNA-binding protein
MEEEKQMQEENPLPETKLKNEGQQIVGSSNKEEKKAGEETNVILIGGKPFMNYVTGVVMQFTTKNQNEVLIRARGKFISKAVDIAEVVRKKFLKESVSVKKIEIGSEAFKSKEGRKLTVSTIDLILTK